MAVVATAGTTNAGIVDDLASVTAVARDRGVWCHVDAAYGGGALFSAQVRSRFTGIEAADSIAIDPHKWLFAPYDCAALLHRVPSLAKAAHAQDAAYLAALHASPRTPGTPAARSGRGGGEEPWNPTDYAFQLSRRSRGLPLRSSLAVHGTERYRDAVGRYGARHGETGGHADRRDAVHHLRPGARALHRLFRRNGWARAQYDAWSDRLLADQVGARGAHDMGGGPAARLALLHPETTLDMVEEVACSTA